MTKVTGESNIHAVMKQRPGAAALFLGRKMNCQSCSGGRLETIEWGARMHGVSVDELVAQLNAQPVKEK